MEDFTLVNRWVPIDLIFSGRCLASHAKSDSELQRRFAFAPLVNIDPYMNAIQNVAAGKSAPPDYHDFERERIHPRPYDALAKEKELRSKLSMTGRYLRRNLPLVAELSQDRLHVNEGLMDACIAKYHMKEWLKVRMPREIATVWDARPTDQLDAVCKKQSRTQIYTPIMHSSYRKYRYSRRGQKRLDMIRRYLGPNLTDMSLLDIGCNCGYYDFHFRRQGMQVTGIDFDREHLEIAEAQVPMYQLDVDLRNIALQEMCTNSRFDIVLAMSVIWHILGWGQLPAALSERELTSKLNMLVGKYLFWESGPDPEREIDLIRNNTDLRSFEKLGTTSATGIDHRIFGVFVRTSK